jgi:hypothetical protein
VQALARQAGAGGAGGAGGAFAGRCLTIIDTIVLNIRTNDAYTYDTPIRESSSFAGGCDKQTWAEGAD